MKGIVQSNRWTAILIFVVTGALCIVGAVSAQSPQPVDPEIPRGAALYDNWLSATARQAPQGNHPLWERQTANTRSGPDTWRCVTCHGWDYQGKDGAYRSGSDFTGFPGVLQASKTMDQTAIQKHLEGSRDPSHDFSQYLSADDRAALAKFIATALINDADYIDPITLKTIQANPQTGQPLYDGHCASCHGNDGKTIVFRSGGAELSLGAMANRDPWRFLHKTRFGTPGTPMVIGYELGWTAEEGRDVLAYAQSLPELKESTEQPPAFEGRESGSPNVGGPANNFFTSILTAIGAMGIGLGFNILIGAALVGIILLIVWILRGSDRK